MDKRSITSAINGAKGGRPKELEDFDGCLTDEVWRPAPGYDKYFVSNMGRVISLKYKNLRIMRVNMNKWGYLSVFLYKNRIKKPFVLSRLVLFTFNGAPEDGLQASHIDGNKLNNKLENLVWETAKENHLRRFDHGTMPLGESVKASKLKEGDVREMRRIYNSEKGLTYSDLGRSFGVSGVTVKKIVSREGWKHVV